MTASAMLFAIACVVAVLGFALAGLIWTAHPVRGNAVECGTLRNPVAPVTVARPVSTVDPGADIEAALAPHRCDQARASVMASQRMSLGAGGVAAATAAGALFAARREKQYAFGERGGVAGAHPTSELNGYGLPGRPLPVIRLVDPGVVDPTSAWTGNAATVTPCDMPEPEPR